MAELHDSTANFAAIATTISEMLLKSCTDNDKMDDKEEMLCICTALCSYHSTAQLSTQRQFAQNTKPAILEYHLNHYSTYSCIPEELE